MFKRTQGEYNRRKPSDFKVGQVYQMAVASRSHVKSPYYVAIKSVGKDFIETEIPGRHSLIITMDNSKWPENWSYHIPRMTLIGSGPEAEELLYNQKNLVPEVKIESLKAIVS